MSFLSDFFTETVPEFFTSQFEDLTPSRFLFPTSTIPKVEAARRAAVARRQLAEPNAPQAQNDLTRAYQQFAQQAKGQQAGTSAPPTGTNYTRRAQKIINRYAPSRPGVVTSAAGAVDAMLGQKDWDTAGLMDLVGRLYRANYLTKQDHEVIKFYGPLRYIGVIQDTVTNLLADADLAGKDSGDFLNEMAARGRIAIPGEGPAPFVPPSRQQVSELDIREVANATAQQILGQQATDEQLASVVSQFRVGEEGAYRSVVEQQRREFGAAAEGKTPPGRPVTITAPPDVSTIAASQFRRTPQGQSFAVAQGILALLNALGQGI